MTEMKISIITVCYNSESVIKKTIESILRQTYDNIEYIVVDGLSEDCTVEIANSFKESFDERGYGFRVVSEKDEGIYDAMNKGIAMARGELVGILNSGDWYEPQAVQRVAETYQKLPFDLFYADIRIWKRGGSMIKRARNRRFVTTRDWNHPTTFIRREVYNTYQYSCRGIYDDWDLILRIRKAGCKIETLNEVLANFSFGGVSNKKSLEAATKRMKERYRIYRENGFSRWYLLECILMETVKYLAA